MTAPTGQERADALMLLADPDLHVDTADLLCRFVLPATPGVVRWATLAGLRETARIAADLNCGTVLPTVMALPGEALDERADREVRGLKAVLRGLIVAACADEDEAAALAARRAKYSAGRVEVPAQRAGGR